MCLLTLISLVCWFHLSPSWRGFISLNWTSNQFSASVDSFFVFSLLPNPSFHSYSLYQTPSFVALDRDRVAHLPLDTLLRSALPMASAGFVYCIWKMAQGSHKYQIFRMIQNPLLLPSSIHLVSLIPHAGPVLSLPGKDCPLCPKPFVWLPLSVFMVPLKPALRDCQTKGPPC